MSRFVAAVKSPGDSDNLLETELIVHFAYMLGCYIGMPPWPVVDEEPADAPPGQRVYGVNTMLEMDGPVYLQTAQDMVAAMGPRDAPTHRKASTRGGWWSPSEITALPAGVPAEELQALSRRARPWLWGDDTELAKTFDDHEIRFVREYRMEADQLLIDAISEYLRHPRQTREAAPCFVQWLCALVDDEQEIRRIIAFVESGGLKPADDAETSIKIEGEGKQK